MKKKCRAISTLMGAAVLVSAPAQQIAAVAEETAQTESFDRIANVQGEFSYNQNVMTPPDEVFSLFGTAATGICATPSFALGNADTQNIYVNIRGTMKKAATISLDVLKEQGGTSTVMACSCGMSGAIANTKVTGVLLEDVIGLQDLIGEVNTVTVRDESGYGLSMPLSYALEKQAMLVWRVGDTELTGENGGPVQLWVPDTVAKYFTRQVAEIELSAEVEVPEIEAGQEEYRTKVSLMNRMAEGQVFSVGDQITFEGYADDIGQAIAAVEFSMDNGETWTSCATDDVTSKMWVYWYFGFTAEQPGTFKLDVRARTADGRVSPLASSVVFTVE